MVGGCSRWLLSACVCLGSSPSPSAGPAELLATGMMAVCSARCLWNGLDWLLAGQASQAQAAAAAAWAAAGWRPNASATSSSGRHSWAQHQELGCLSYSSQTNPVLLMIWSMGECLLRARATTPQLTSVRWLASAGRQNPVAIKTVPNIYHSTTASSNGTCKPGTNGATAAQQLPAPTAGGAAGAVSPTWAPHQPPIRPLLARPSLQSVHGGRHSV